MFALVVSQFITTPLSIVVNAMLARSLGAASFGAIYLATTVLTVAFLFVEWGGTGHVTAEVARRPRDAGRVVATGLVLRIAFATAVLFIVPVFSTWMGYAPDIRLALTLCGFRFAIASVNTLFTAVLRGFEKVHWEAVVTVCGAVAEAVLVVTALLLGGGLRGVLIADIVATSLTAGVAFVLFLRLRAGHLAIDRRAVKVLLGGGFTFLMLDVVVKLQPTIDVAYLSSLAPGDVLGWHSAAMRIILVLSFPALTLHTALYPTLSRLWESARPQYVSMARGALRVTVVVGVLAAAGTAMFSGQLISIVYGQKQYGAAAVNLRVLSVYIVLVYLSIVAAAALAAARRQARWMVAQSFCLVVSLILDPLLIPVAATRFGNGSIGVCVSLVVAELAMAGSGLALLPRGVLDRGLFQTMLRCAVAAGAMAFTALAMGGFAPAAMVGSVCVYAGTLYALGEIDRRLVDLLKGTILAPVTPLFARFDRWRVSVCAEP
jgi:O-antigen/teichoic acid export membrane protein